jgi:hypothetical protein
LNGGWWLTIERHLLAAGKNKMDNKISASTQEIIDNMRTYIEERGGNYSDWHAGLCQEIQNIIINIYRVNSRCWTYCETPSPQVAKEVLNYCINTLGIAGDVNTQEADSFSRIVYVYKKPHTL